MNSLRIRNSFFALFLFILALCHCVNATENIKKTQNDILYDRVIKQVEKTLINVKKPDYKHLEMLLWYAVKLKPDRMTAYLILNCIYAQCIMDKEKTSFIIRKGYNVAKKTKHPRIAFFAHQIMSEEYKKTGKSVPLPLFSIGRYLQDE